MQNETWKWGVVFILLAIFLVTANQAYQHVTSQETFEPPDDYLKGDSWDIEHQGGPGAGQPMQLSPDMPEGFDRPLGESASEPVEVLEPIVIEDDIDWNKVKDPSEE
ncbi:MAG: hypothetical protein A2W80_12845 [Candidatus Riflebacteria bacterium GWC2_50_8]|nr:MAG: hypothetical protein A2W80_12845 [Candidatus Riflebacteria bacterium GWC2_50_8]